MKKIFFSILLCVLCSPLSLWAHPEIFLSSSDLPYQKDMWTSDTTPQTWSNMIAVRWWAYQEDFPLSFFPSEMQKQERIMGLFSDLSQQEQTARYEALLSLNHPEFLNYLTLALSPDIDSDIAARESFWDTLTPFESVFQACNISLSNRRDIVRILIDRISSWDFLRVEELEYSDVVFGDCIIPFPDHRRTSSEILALTNTFPSNRYLAEVRWWNFLRFSEAQEQNISVLWWDAVGFQRVSDLDLETQRIESNTILQKSHGKNRIVYAHINRYVNPFRNAYITASEIGWMNYQWESFSSGVFWLGHPLYIEASAEESKRTLLPWTQVRPGIYQKILLQENSFDAAGNPRQKVGATSYYAIVYNFDITPPVCEATLFSHDSIWNETFLLTEDSWFQSQKYVSFVCWDIESGCVCDSSDTDCFIRDGKVISLPQELPHQWGKSFDFFNAAWKTVSCSTSTEEKVRYDFTSPDISVRKDGLPLSWLSYEYVSQDGRLYDGVQIRSRRYYSIEQISSFGAGEDMNIDFQFFDLPSIGSWEDVSWIEDFQWEISVKNGTMWEHIGSFERENLEGNVLLSLSEINSSLPWRDIQRKTWRYQLTFHLKDRAGNTARVIWQYQILPGPLDTAQSLVEISERHIMPANNAQFYEYSLTLRDSFWNPIPAKELQTLAQTCTWVALWCRSIMTDMTQDTPSGSEALQFTPVWTWVSDDEGRLYFQVRSLAPGTFTERFQVNFQNPSESHIFLAEENSFLKPLIWTLETFDAWVWYDDRLYVWEERDYRVAVTMTWVSVTPNFSLIGAIVARHPETSFSLSGSVISSPAWLAFRGMFTSSLSEPESHKTLLEIVDGSVSWIVVSYILWWHTIRYRLSSSDRNNTPLILTDTRELQEPVKLIGGLQASWNTQNLSERQNISDISSSLQRTLFRKNITQYIMGRTHDTIVWWVRYIDMTHSGNKNFTLESNPDNYDTLVVRNGNILITQDFNLSWKKVWLISYIDNGYNVETWYNSVWNIYVSPDVSRINAFIYADGALVSTNASWIPIVSEKSVRSELLSHQLRITWLLFTRNTLAGSRELAGNYMLPGWRENTNWALAVQYDLYQTRRGNSECDRDSYGFCNIPHYFIIEYDNRIVSSPPPLFSQ